MTVINNFTILKCNFVLKVTYPCKRINKIVVAIGLIQSWFPSSHGKVMSTPTLTHCPSTKIRDGVLLNAQKI